MASTAPKACGENKNQSFLFFFCLLDWITTGSRSGPPHPAGPTGSLVPDLRDCGAVGPLLAGVKAVRKLYPFSVVNPEPENEADKRYLLTVIRVSM